MQLPKRDQKKIQKNKFQYLHRKSRVLNEELMYKLNRHVRTFRKQWEWNYLTQHCKCCVAQKKLLVRSCFEIMTFQTYLRWEPVTKQNNLINNKIIQPRKIKKERKKASLVKIFDCDACTKHKKQQFKHNVVCLNKLLYTSINCSNLAPKLRLLFTQ